MASRKRNDLTFSRRRVEDEGEDEELPIGDDESSIGTLQSDAEHEADVDEGASDLEATPALRRTNSKRENGAAINGKAEEDNSIRAPADLSTMSADTVAMMNGLEIKDAGNDAESIQFGENLDDTSIEAGKLETIAEKRKREHEEYKKKRDADPAFVPNRGGFFMHDSRNVFQGPNGFRPGRGRARGGRGGLPFSPHAQSGMAADAPWAHDLHETAEEVEPIRSIAVAQPASNAQTSALPARPLVPPLSSTPPNRTFSRTIQVGNVNLRVLMPNMKEPIIFSAVPVHSHTRLPHHRPPLRRDKPVRVSIPDHIPRYIFPATDRSFVFIPRAMRPNQQGFGRSRGRGSFGGYGNFSARNSIFGGSIYSPSVAHSRRSSIAREIGRDGVASPAGSVMSRNRSFADPSKPVVRLPPSMDPALYGQYPHPGMQFMPHASPIVNLPLIQPMAIPQRPISQNFAGSIPMHQPRPQKQITVADIESPAALNFPPPQVQQQQPFHHQVPTSLNGQGYVPDMGSSHSRRTSHPSQHGTPLSQIPERAIHAQTFQPAYQYPQQQQPFYPQQFAAPIYYYGQPMPSAVAAPPFVPGQQYPYMVPATPMVPPEIPAQPGTVAHESNGMVYYYDSSQLTATGPEDPAAYQQMGYAPPAGYVMAAQTPVYYTTQ